MGKLIVEFEENINIRPLTDRKYILGHSDETGMRFLYIGSQFFDIKFCDVRDEVMGEWLIDDDKAVFYANCLIDCEASKLSKERRFQLFERHMPRALAAMLYGDKAYIEANKLQKASVIVNYLSQDPEYQDIRHYGVVCHYTE